MENTQTKISLKNRWFVFAYVFLSFSLISLLLFPGTAYSAGYSVTYVGSTSPYAGVTYSTSAGSGAGNVLTFNVQAQSTPGTLDAAVTDTVTVGLYDTGTGLPADPSAVFVPASGSPVTSGTAALTFVNGILNFSVTLTAGSNSMQMSISGPNITSGNTFPGSIGVTTGPGYMVRGFYQPYYLQTLSNSNVAAVYSPLSTPVSTDLLLTLPTTNTTSSLVVTVTNVNTDPVTNAVCFAVTGVNSGYAAGGAGVSFNLYFYKTDLTTAPVSYEVIMDYGKAPSGPLTDYNNPDLTYDTVYRGSDTDVGQNKPTLEDSVDSVTGAAPQPFMTNGQIILRSWTSAPAGNTVNLLWSPGGYGLSYINVPYSSSNVQPVRSVLNLPGAAAFPSTVLDGGAVTLVDTFLNQFNSPITQVVFLIPANSSGVSNWSITSASDAFGPCNVVNPTGTTPGTIIVNMTSQPVTTNQAFPVTLIGTAAGQDGSWPMSMVSALNNNGNTAPLDSSKALVYSIAAPPVPGSFNAVPANYTSTGGVINLSWNQVTTENPQGYLLTRNTVGGAFAASVTLPDGSVYPNGVLLPAVTTNFSDTNAVNLSPTTYQILTYNTVGESAFASTGPVTAFANPAAPGPVTALTGGAAVQLNWGAPASVLGSYAVTGIQVLRSINSSMSGASTLATLAGSSTAYNDPSPSAAVTNYYELVSLDSQYPSGPSDAHLSGPSSQAQADPPGYPPAGAGTTLVSVSPATIGFYWSSPDPTLMLNGPATGYQVEISPDGVFGSFVTVAALPVTYDDTSATVGHYYVYQVRAFDNAGFLSNPSAPVTGYILPAAPAGLTASSSSNAVTLNWGAVNNQGVTSYTIYQNSVSVGSTGSGSTAFIDSTGLTVGTNYVFQVSASNAGGEGPLSLPVTMSLLPSAPTGLAVTATASDVVTLTWSAPSAPETNVTGYNLYRSPSAAFGVGATQLGAGQAGYNFTDVTLGPSAAGSILYYYAQAQNIAGAGPISPAVGVMIPPNHPIGIGASSTSSVITVIWTLNPASENVKEYSLYRINNPLTTPVTQLISTTPNGGFNSLSDNSASQGVSYAYYVTATNFGSGLTIVGGESLPSAAVTWGLAPQTPAGLAVSLLDAQNDMAVTWPAIADASVTGIYSLAATTSSASSAVTNVLSSASVSLGYPTQAGDTTYYYWLQTLNAFGTSALDGPVSQLTYPSAPVLNSVNLLPDDVSVALNWVTVGTGDVTVYNIYRQLNSNQSILVQPVTVTAGFAMPITFQWPVQNGQTYTFQISASNATGEGPRSAPLSILIGPSSPASLTAQSGTSTSQPLVSLAWAPNPAIQAITGYNIYRAPGPVTGSGPASTAYTPITSVSSLGTSFVDATAADGTAYYYMVEAELGGLQSPLNTNLAMPVTAFRLPNAPGSPSATPASNQVVLAWSDPAATTYPVSGYDVFRVTSAGVTGAPITFLPASAAGYTDNAVTNGTNYYYSLQTVDMKGNLSAPTAPVTAEPLVQPGAPVSVGIYAGDTEIQITWLPGTAGTLPIGGYQIYQVSGGVTTPVTMVSSTTTGYVVTGLTNTISYTYYLVAVDNSGITSGLHISANSASVTNTPSTNNINQPSNLSATGGVAQVAVSWTDAAGGASPVTGYQLYRSTAQFSGYAALTIVGLGGSFTDAPVTNGTTYYYYLVSIDHLGTYCLSGSATVFATPARPPNAPVSLGESDGDNAVTLRWVTNGPLDKVNVLEYLITRNSAPLTTVNSAVTAANIPVTDVDTPAADGSTFVYQVYAVNTNGVTSLSPSSPVTGYPYALGPPAVTSTSSNADVTLTWSAPATHSFNITGYAIYRRTAAGTYNLTEPLTVVGSGVSIYVDTTASLGQLYGYEVEALDAVGHAGQLSAEVLDGPANPPPAPTGLNAQPGDQQILIDWAPAGAPSAGGLPVSEYQVIITSGGAPTTILTTQTWLLEPSTNGVSVTFTVAAIDSTGQAVPGIHESGAVTITSSSVTGNLNPPTGLTAKGTTANTIQLTWTPANDLGRIVSGYAIYRTTSYSATLTAPVTTLYNTAFAAVTLFNDTGLSENVTYFYVARAVYSVPSGTSSNSNHAYSTTLKPPAPPPGVKSGQMVFDANLVRPLLGQTLGIYYDLAASGPVELNIYNIAGRVIRTLSPPAAVAGAQVKTSWDMKDKNGNVVASGIYLIEIKSGSYHQILKVAVVK